MNKINDTALSMERIQPFRAVLKAFDIQEAVEIKPFGSGLINHTWKVAGRNGEYILQKVNHHVFTNPEEIACNIRLIANYLAKCAPEYLFVTPASAKNGADLVQIDGESYFRLFPFVSNSFTRNVVKTPAQAYEAAAQFGKFTRLLHDFDAKELKITIPDFHNLTLRYAQFLDAISNGKKERVIESKEWIDLLQKESEIVSEYEVIKVNPEFKVRVTHHDTKISNVLFDENDKGICVIDLDTMMPGYFISDVGDMMRTYLSPVSEEENDLTKIGIRDDFYKAIVDGYYQEMKEELTETEKKYFFYAGKFMIYMQALRYLTDHLNGDVYYGAKYEGQNLVRAKNQVVLLKQLREKEETLNRMTF